MRREVRFLMLAAMLAAAAARGGRIEEIKKDLETQPDNVDLYVELALEYDDVKDYKKAQDTYKMALALAPSDANIHYRLAESYLADENLPAAIESYRDVLRLDAAQKICYYQMGRAYMGLRDYARGAEALEAFVATAPADFNALWYLGQCYEKQGQYDKALARYEEIYDLSTGPYASAGEVGVFGTNEDLKKHIDKISKKVR